MTDVDPDRFAYEEDAPNQYERDKAAFAVDRAQEIRAMLRDAVRKAALALSDIDMLDVYHYPPQGDKQVAEVIEGACNDAESLFYSLLDRYAYETAKRIAEGEDD